MCMLCLSVHHNYTAAENATSLRDLTFRRAVGRNVDEVLAVACSELVSLTLDTHCVVVPAIAATSPRIAKFFYTSAALSPVQAFVAALAPHTRLTELFIPSYSLFNEDELLAMFDEFTGKGCSADFYHRSTGGVGLLTCFLAAAEV